MNEGKTKKERLKELRAEASKKEGIEREVLNELARLTEDERLYVFRPETRCRVCNADGAAETINRLLAHAMTHADILRTIEPINMMLPEGQRITMASIRRHAERHFPIAQTAQATYRRIVERRAEEHGIDFINGVGNALTPIAYMDVMMQKAYENMVKDETPVTPEGGLRAAKELNDIVERSGQSEDMADVMVKVNRLVDAVKSTVPREMWPVILEKVNRDEQIIDADIEPQIEVEPEYGEAYDPGDPDLYSEEY